jgi:uncharacterized protein
LRIVITATDRRRALPSQREPTIIAAYDLRFFEHLPEFAFQPLAGANVYAASEAFVLFFSEALSLELSKTGVKVTAGCPGPVATEFFAKMNPKLQANQMDQPGSVVSEILRVFERGKRVVYPGKLANRLSTWGARFGQSLLGRW